MQEAKAKLRNIVDEHGLCLKLTGLYQSEGACFYHQIDRCNGACVGKESIHDYNERINRAFEKYSNKAESLIIVDRGRRDDERSVVLINKGQYLGYGYFDEMEALEDPEQVYNLISMKKDTKDVHQIIRNYLKNNRVEKLIHF
jgi:DNA polymerase-3 subunit epsilon